jgi:predicted peptidase
VFLHGTGGNGSDNLRHLTPELDELVSRAQAVEPTFVLAPQCPNGDKWVSGDRGTPHLNYSQGVRLQSDASKLVLQLVSELTRTLPIDPDRLSITGYSAGGSGTWDMVSRFDATIFAAAAPVTGANDPSRASVIRDLPIWAFHGALDRTSPTANTREMVQTLRELGSAVRYTEYPDVGHNVWVRAYREPELVPWLLAQRRRSAR